MIQPQKIRVLYFDQSADTLIRFVELCERWELIDLVGTFRSFGELAPLLEEDGWRLLQLLAPDVVVLRLTVRDEAVAAGLQQLKRNCRVKLVGLLGEDCARDRALLGALDYHTPAAPPDSPVTDDDVYTRLFYQIKSARLALQTQQAGVRGRWAVLPLPPKPAGFRQYRLIAIGASAGGTQAVTAILSALPATLPPILVVQHIPDSFAAFFAKNLAAKVAPRVVLAQDEQPLEDGTVYIAANDRHLEVARREEGGFCARCIGGEKISGHRPSVDALFTSVARAAGAAAIGVILTGMGSDGAHGLLEMHEAGAYTIGQDKESSAVYGMPMVAYTLGAVSRQLPLNAIAKAILSAAGGREEADHAQH